MPSRGRGLILVLWIILCKQVRVPPENKNGGESSASRWRKGVARRPQRRFTRNLHCSPSLSDLFTSCLPRPPFCDYRHVTLCPHLSCQRLCLSLFTSTPFPQRGPSTLGSHLHARFLPGSALHLGPFYVEYEPQLATNKQSRDWPLQDRIVNVR